MVFLLGDHVLNKNITVANVARLTMHGESSSGSVARIVCNGSVGLNFKSVVDLKISSLVFTSCSRKYNTRNFSKKYNTSNFLLPGSYALHLQSTQYAELVKCSFKNNVGTALLVDNTTITYAEKNEFTYDHCESSSCVKGRGITAFRSNLIFTENTTFLENYAYDGGAIYASNNTVLIFEGTSNFIRNSAGSIGGAIYISQNTVLFFNGTSNFIGNSALFSSGAICAEIYCTLTFYGTIHFIDNSAPLGGAIYTSHNTVLSLNGTSNFIGNSAVYGGAIRVDVTSTLKLDGTVNFTGNGYNKDSLNGDATYGGGLYMVQKTTLSVLPNTTVYWEKNHATYGGAIYITDAIPLSYCTSIATYIPKEECFFQLPDQNLSSGIDAQLVFKNNSADAAGSVLYGGAVDNCKLTGLESYSSGEVFDKLVHIKDDNTNSSVSSEPFHMCPCDNNYPDCSVSSIYYTAYPGETFQFSVVGVGQRNGTVPAAVRGTLNPGYEYFQTTNSTCTSLNNTVFSLNEVIIKLYADGPCSTFSGMLNLVLTINQNCPPGFVISESARSCICEQRLSRYTNSCYITDGVGRITRDSLQHFWVGYDNQLDSQFDKLILHPLCPFDYCISQTVAFPLNNSDIQCAFSRSGLLCGACKKGYSLVLGTSQCKHCTNGYLALLVPFALMGLALVFLLLVCKLTVASGTLSGLLFYANIVGANRTMFLPVESTSVFSVFIAWLNLDFGIQTCFYHGMDAYSKTWLQFVFPVYVWMIVGFIIVTSNFSLRFTKLLGNNPVSVLATLILLSYTKILRTLIAVIYVTFLEYPTYNRRVWLYDANIEYLVGKHIPLFLVAVFVFLFLFLPYTLLLLFGQWLQVISHLKLFSWVNSARMKAFMDSYHAPYKAKHRYWPGLLLMVRLALLLVFSLNFQQNTSVNLLAILVGTAILHFWAWISGGVYRNWCLNVLEGSFVLNLIILAAATYHVNQSGGNQLAAGYTSVFIALVTLIGILAYHIFKQLRHTKVCKNIQLKLKFNRLSAAKYFNDPVNDPVDIPRVEDAHFDHFREPLLENQQQPNYGTS